MGKLKKTVGNLGKLISVIPDTTELIVKTIENARPIIEKQLDRRHDLKSSLVQLDDVVHLNIDDAKNIIEKKGLHTVAILSHPNIKYINYEKHQVVKMVPKSGKYPKDTLVKLYYVNDTTLSKSKDLFLEKKRKDIEKKEQIRQFFKPKPFNKKENQSESQYEDSISDN